MSPSENEVYNIVLEVATSAQKVYLCSVICLNLANKNIQPFVAQKVVI
jgi:hypothetical protein